MKALSIQNPYAYFVASGLKDVENRRWQTRYRGKLVIHATGALYAWIPYDCLPDAVFEVLKIDNGKDFGELHPYSQGFELLHQRAERHFGVQTNAFESLTMEQLEEVVKIATDQNGPPFISSAIIGEVELVDIVRDSGSPWAEFGSYHWILRNARLYDTPIIGVKGHLRVWDFEMS